MNLAVGSLLGTKFIVCCEVNSEVKDFYIQTKLKFSLPLNIGAKGFTYFRNMGAVKVLSINPGFDPCILVFQQNALRYKNTSKVFTTEFREGVAMPTASEELIALVESAMDGGQDAGGGGALSGAYNHICTPSQCCGALTQKSVSRVVCACHRAYVRACGGACGGG